MDKNLQKIGQIIAVLLLMALGASGQYQRPHIGSANGLDTINISGVMKATKGLIIRDTFTNKPGDFAQYWRNSSKLAFLDSAARAYFPELLLNTTTRTGAKLIVNGTSTFAGVMTFTNSTGIDIRIPSAFLNTTIGYGNSTPTTGFSNTVIGESNIFSVNRNRQNIFGYNNNISASAQHDMFVLGNNNTVTSSDGQQIIIGYLNTVNYASTGSNTPTIFGSYNTINHNRASVYGRNQTTTADNQLIFGLSYDNLTGVGFNDVYFGSGPRSKNSDTLGTSVTINASGAGNGTDKTGGNLRLAAGKGTGAATARDVIFATTSTTTSGTTLQSLTDRWYVKGTTGTLANTSSPSASAALQVNSTTQGILPPRMTGAQAEAISSPAEGLMIYSTDGTGATITSKGWWGYDGSAWVKLN